MKKKIVFVHGKFNVLHAGHFSLFKNSRDLGDKLVVGVYADSLNLNDIYVNEKLRLEALKHINLIDKLVLINHSIKRTIEKEKPDLVIKGIEFKDKFNEEVSYSKKLKFKLLFSNSSMGLSEISLFNKKKTEIKFRIDDFKMFLKRRNVTKKQLLNSLRKLSNLKVLTIGDIIVDEYIDLDLLGLSREDNSIVYSPKYDSKAYVGGAGVVSLQANSIGCDSEIVSILGNDERKRFVKKTLNHSKVKNKIFINKSTNTLLKQRYQYKKKSIFRLSHLNDSIENLEIKKSLINYLNKCLMTKDLVIVSDFNYGTISEDIFSLIKDLTSKYKIPLIVDSQSSSQIGSYNKYKFPDCITPTEYEARISTHDSSSGLPVLSEKLRDITKAKHIFITLGSQGIYANTKNGEVIEEDNIVALNPNPINISGAGDSFLVGMSTILAISKNIWEAAAFGSIFAALKVSKEGNLPVKLDDIKNFLYKL